MFHISDGTPVLHWRGMRMPVDMSNPLHRHAAGTAQHLSRSLDELDASLGAALELIRTLQDEGVNFVDGIGECAYHVFRTLENRINLIQVLRCSMDALMCALTEK